MIINKYVPDIGKYYPWYYKDILETDELIRTENDIFKNIYLILWEIQINQFVLTANEDGIERFEHMLNIIADPLTEDLEFRRQRILNRLSIRTPFTLRYLKNRLWEMFGEYAEKQNSVCTASVNYGERILYVDLPMLSDAWYTEIMIWVNKIKPANMIMWLRINMEITATDYSAGIISDSARDFIIEETPIADKSTVYYGGGFTEYIEEVFEE